MCRQSSSTNAWDIFIITIPHPQKAGNSLFLVNYHISKIHLRLNSRNLSPHLCPPPSSFLCSHDRSCRNIGDLKHSVLDDSTRLRAMLKRAGRLLLLHAGWEKVCVEWYLMIVHMTMFDNYSSKTFVKDIKLWVDIRRKTRRSVRQWEADSCLCQQKYSLKKAGIKKKLQKEQQREILMRYKEWRGNNLTYLRMNKGILT